MNQPITYPSIRHMMQNERLLLGALGTIALIRMVAIIMTPLEFGVDEAQYWLWGQYLDFGYYSKPPLIGWYLGLMDGLFGSSTIAARLATPLIHSVIALVLYAIASAHHSASAGRWAALLWVSLPIVSLGTFVISTDTLLLLPWVFALALFLKAEASGNLRGFFLTGLVIGIGLLAKYAAIYFILGAALCLLGARLGGRFNALRKIGALIAGALVTASPNLIWNLVNGGITFSHLGENADLAEPSYSLASAAEFLLSQSGVIGPLAFILFCAAILRLRRQMNLGFAQRLLCFSVPVILIMTTQAFLKTANANWAATAWPAACLLIGCALAQKEPFIVGRIWGRLALSINYFAAFMIAASVAFGTLGQWTPASDPLRRLRGWEALASDVAATAQAHNIATIIADRRAEAALLSWHLHDSPYQVRVYDEDGRPGSHFELRHALSEADQGPFMILTGPDGVLPDALAKQATEIGESLVKISNKRDRHKRFFIVKSLF